MCVWLLDTQHYLAGNCEAWCRASWGGGGCRIFNVWSKTRFCLDWPDLAIFQQLWKTFCYVTSVFFVVFFEFRNSHCFKTPMTIVLNTVNPAKLEHVIAVMCFFWSFLLLPKRFLGKRCLQLPWCPQRALFLMPDITQAGVTVPFCWSISAASPKKKAKQAVITVVIRVFVVNYTVEGSNFLVRIPDRKTNRLLKGRLFLWKTLSRPIKHRKENKTKRCCITFLFCCSVPPSLCKVQTSHRKVVNMISKTHKIANKKKEIKSMNMQWQSWLRLLVTNPNNFWIYDSVFW